MDNFKQTPEYILSQQMQPACDRVLKHVFKSDNIKRFEKGDELFVLDQEFHIDLVLTLPNSSQITGQEKTLSNDFYGFRTFTMEFYQNRYTKEKGEFFKIASQFYLHGYSHKNGHNFIEWKIINILSLLSWLKSKPISELERSTRPSGGSRANFFFMPYDNIPNDFIIAQWRHNKK
jgi:hypothetical protein